jgi:predicted transcriptional regulator YheO
MTDRDILPVFSDHDRQILRSLTTAATGIARQFGEYCEVVVHSLEDYEQSILSIENGEVTGRKVGGPMTDFALSVLENFGRTSQEVYGPYYTTTDSGKTLKSTTTIVKNTAGKPIGFLCINFDISAPFASLMESLLRDAGSDRTVSEHFPLTAKDLVDTSFREVVETVHRTTGVSPTQKNKIIVEELYRRGIFHIKNGIDIVADRLGVSRYTIYNYIREVKTSLGEKDIEKMYS